MRVERLRLRPSGTLALSAETGLSPLSRQILSSRGLSAPADALTLTELLPPDTLKGAEAAADFILTTLRSDGRILIVGDYDVDGATSTALMVGCLCHDYGARVDYFIPNRFTHGYGLSPSVVASLEALDEPLPDLLITVDNGIASQAGVAAARALGIQVIVTDHHLPGTQPCDADAVVNPSQPGCGFPSKHACGCTVAFYVLLVLRRRAADWLEEQGREPPVMGDYLDLVALATIADVVPLDGNNRILVEQGLRRMRAGAARPGILALLEVAGRDPARLHSQDLGFVLGPRLNAAGRMDDMTVGVACLLADNMDDARALAGMLEDFNQARKQVQTRMVDGATEQIRKALSRMDNVDETVHVLWDTDWHEGVVGLVAGRIKERYQRPVIALCPGEDGHFKGSGRSIPGVHMRDLLALVDARHPGLLHKFGGHAMAAGLTVAEDALPHFQSAVKAAADDLVEPSVWVSEWLVDARLKAQHISLTQAEELNRLGPWGQGCPPPLFANQFTVVSQRWLGERHLKLTLRLADMADSSEPVDAIWFFCPLDPQTELATSTGLIYELSVNEYRGRRSVQLMIKAQVDTDLLAGLVDST